MSRAETMFPSNSFEFDQQVNTPQDANSARPRRDSIGIDMFGFGSPNLLGFGTPELNDGFSLGKGNGMGFKQDPTSPFGGGITLPLNHQHEELMKSEQPDFSLSGGLGTVSKNFAEAGGYHQFSPMMHGQPGPIMMMSHNMYANNQHQHQHQQHQQAQEEAKKQMQQQQQQQKKVKKDEKQATSTDVSSNGSFQNTVNDAQKNFSKSANNDSKKGKVAGSEGAALDDSKRKIGTLTVEERRIKIKRYLEKRKRRTWCKKITYDCRKRVADNRLRIKGRFVTREQAHAILGSSLQEEMDNCTDPKEAIQKAVDRLENEQGGIAKKKLDKKTLDSVINKERASRGLGPKNTLTKSKTIANPTSTTSGKSNNMPHNGQNMQTTSNMIPKQEAHDFPTPKKSAIVDGMLAFDGESPALFSRDLGSSPFGVSPMLFGMKTPQSTAINGMNGFKLEPTNNNSTTPKLEGTPLSSFFDKSPANCGISSALMKDNFSLD
eukprot:CAMPEP_0115019200 /NCGR_PEP_ID=MMETSP0216-20121206/29291_1 /TAXON_ID=223996 /ORGANISM="Protocruzia adherens, Strain Boccale" /LENGTH=490 /DNA_ID=CAMNT_0002390603 /DNA_START=156 /DNA_END=1628 /DNA_ORIENTATION=+